MTFTIKITDNVLNDRINIAFSILFNESCVYFSNIFTKSPFEDFKNNVIALVNAIEKNTSHFIIVFNIADTSIISSMGTLLDPVEETKIIFTNGSGEFTLYVNDANKTNVISEFKKLIEIKNSS